MSTTVTAKRFPENPIVTPSMAKPFWKGFEVLCTFNAGVTTYRDEVILILRIAERPPKSSDPNIARCPFVDFSHKKPRLEILEFRKDLPNVDSKDPRVVEVTEGDFKHGHLTYVSYLRVARSKDGRHFTVDPEPLLLPTDKMEEYGAEDCRITKLGDTYYFVYKTVCRDAITVRWASTKDFRKVLKVSPLLFSPTNLDVAIFPQKIGGKYAALTRPVPAMFGAPNIWIAYSKDLIYWGDHRLVMKTRPGMWDGGRIGASAVPFKTKAGWLEIYHGASPQQRYCLGAALLDLKDPSKCIARSAEPILQPEAPCEMAGFFGNVVFSCGALVDGDKLTVYYGASDEVTCGAELSINEILHGLKKV